MSSNAQSHRPDIWGKKCLQRLSSKRWQLSYKELLSALFAQRPCAHTALAPERIGQGAGAGVAGAQGRGFERLAAGQGARFLPLRYLCDFYVKIIRGTPLIVQVYFFYYIIGTAWGIDNRVLAGIIILSLVPMIIGVFRSRFGRTSSEAKSQ